MVSESNGAIAWDWDRNNNFPETSFTGYTDFILSFGSELTGTGLPTYNPFNFQGKLRKIKRYETRCLANASRGKWTPVKWRAGTFPLQHRPVVEGDRKGTLCPKLLLGPPKGRGHPSVVSEQIHSCKRLKRRHILDWTISSTMMQGEIYPKVTEVRLSKLSKAWTRLFFSTPFDVDVSATIKQFKCDFYERKHIPATRPLKMSPFEFQFHFRKQERTTRRIYFE